MTTGRTRLTLRERQARAVREGRADEVFDFLTRGTHEESLDRLFDLAVTHDQPEVARLLLQFGANPESTIDEEHFLEEPPQESFLYETPDGEDDAEAPSPFGW